MTRIEIGEAAYVKPGWDKAQAVVGPVTSSSAEMNR